MGRRTLLLVAALVIAALGTTGVFLYVNGVDERAQANYDLVEVLVATAPIAAGTTAQQASDAGALDRRAFLQQSLEGLPALSDISGIADQVALAPIAAGEPILESQFGRQNQTGTLVIPDGKMAVSVELTDPARVAGFVVPGSKVAIFLTTGDGQSGTTRLLLNDIEVLAAGQNTESPAGSDTAPAEDLPRALLTLAVDQREAQKIVYASTQAGQLYFTLLRDNSLVSETDPGTNSNNLFD